MIRENAIKVTVSRDVPAMEQICPQQSVEVQRSAAKKTHQVECAPAIVKLIGHVLVTFCSPICERDVKVAEAPPSPIPGSIATPSLLAHITTSSLSTACRS